MSEISTPKVFISYSWSNEELVMTLAERLTSHGVYVIVDKWDLKEGQDKYTFMEQCVNDSSIKKVLIICDKKYSDKANARTGGVGDETVIISSEVYGNTQQEKYIPIIAERDEDGNPYVPTYIKSRIFIDLSDESMFEDEYEKLLRNIYDKPLHVRPSLGKMPEWLDEKKNSLLPLSDRIKQLKGATNPNKQASCVNEFIEKYIQSLMSIFSETAKDGKAVFDRYINTKPLRDVFLDFLPALFGTDLACADVVCNVFEKMYNTLTHGKMFCKTSIVPGAYDLEVYKILIWELFVCTIAYLRHVEDYDAIHAIVTNTYFLDIYQSGEEPTAVNYCWFQHSSRIIEYEYKPKTEHKQRLTLLGDILCTEREKLPIYSSESIAEADLFLYQIKNALNLVSGEHDKWHHRYWFPVCYPYCKKSPVEWIKMKSRKYCSKMYKLFGVSTLEELKNDISSCVYDGNVHYSGDPWNCAPAILSSIKLDEIGSVN